MTNTTKSGIYLGAEVIGVLVILTLAGLPDKACGYSPQMRRAMMAGPWEIVVQISADGVEERGLSFPLSVSDDNKQEKLDAVLPIMGTPAEIHLVQYVPDLKWETSVVTHRGGGVVAELSVKGPNLNQQFWLNSDDPARQSMSSPVGGIALRRIHDAAALENLMRELTTTEAVGVLSIWVADSNQPAEYPARRGAKVAPANSGYEITILDYVPHYRIDTETKEVVSQSRNPLNPAIRVSVSDGHSAHDQWLWSKFPSSPHQGPELPFSMRFTDFDLGDMKGWYIIAAAPQSQPWLLFSKDGAARAEKAILGQPYPFADKAYSFALDKLTHNAVIKSNWKNNTEDLLNPAIVASLKNTGADQEVVLQLNKPAHLKTRLGTMVLIYTRRSEGSPGAQFGEGESGS